MERRDADDLRRPHARLRLARRRGRLPGDRFARHARAAATRGTPIRSCTSATAFAPSPTTGPVTAAPTRSLGRSVADAAADIAALADELGFERFAVVGGSGGAPHALACGALLADRVDPRRRARHAGAAGRGELRLLRRPGGPECEGVQRRARGPRGDRSLPRAVRRGDPRRPGRCDRADPRPSCPRSTASSPRGPSSGR